MTTRSTIQAAASVLLGAQLVGSNASSVRTTTKSLRSCAASVRETAWLARSNAASTWKQYWSPRIEHCFRPPTPSLDPCRDVVSSDREHIRTDRALITTEAAVSTTEAAACAADRARRTTRATLLPRGQALVSTEAALLPTTCDVARSEAAILPTFHVFPTPSRVRCPRERRLRTREATLRTADQARCLSYRLHWTTWAASASARSMFAPFGRGPGVVAHGYR